MRSHDMNANENKRNANHIKCGKYIHQRKTTFTSIHSHFEHVNVVLYTTKYRNCYSKSPYNSFTVNFLTASKINNTKLLSALL